MNVHQHGVWQTNSISILNIIDLLKKVITIKSKTQILKKTKKVKAGDLLYWDFDNDKEINHATIVTSNAKEKGKKVLRYGGHTKARNNVKVKDSYVKSNVLKVIRLKDKFTIPYNC